MWAKVEDGSLLLTGDFEAFSGKRGEVSALEESGELCALLGKDDEVLA